MDEKKTCALTRYGAGNRSCWTVSDDRTGTVRGNYSTEQDARTAASLMGYAEARLSPAYGTIAA